MNWSLDQPLRWVTPAQKRFKAAPLAGLHVKELLIMHLELATCDRVPQVALQRVSRFQLGRHRFIVKREAVSARRF
jgi:hypothetical protein